MFLLIWEDFIILLYPNSQALYNVYRYCISVTSSNQTYDSADFPKTTPPLIPNSRMKLMMHAADGQSLHHSHSLARSL